jgi:uncharacterized Zn finger protein (UPF0148 family)
MDNQRAAWMERAAEEIRMSCNDGGETADGNGWIISEEEMVDIIRAAYESRDPSTARQLCGPGGCAYGLCEKHGVPLISTITEQTYCAVCESWRAQQLEQQLAAANARCAAMREATTSVATTLHAQAEEVHKAEQIALAIHLHNLGDELQAAADSSDAAVEQIAKDHRVMNLFRDCKVHYLECTGRNDHMGYGAAPFDGDDVYAADPADAILAAEAAQQEDK